VPRVYLDHNATAPVRPEATLAMLAALSEHWGNASSVHWAGAAAREAVERARAQVAALAGVAAEQLTFTSGATESNNMALLAAAHRNAREDERDEIVSCASEHASLLESCALLREQGLRVRMLQLDRDGRLDPARFEAELGPRTRLASVMWVNTETGVVQPIAELARAARRQGVRFHTDAAQALGKLPLGLGALPVDFASFSGHKLGGPKGVGALYARAERAPSLLRGGAQERGGRAGTLNVPGIVGFGAACEAAAGDRVERAERLGRIREWLWEEIEKRVPDVHRNGCAEHTAPHTLNVSFPGAAAEVLVEALDLEGFAVAAGSACHSGSVEPSHVVLAMGLGLERARSAIRISMGATTTPSDLEALMDVLPRVVARVRGALA
jgi:cysteine desulfurase